MNKERTIWVKTAPEKPGKYWFFGREFGQEKPHITLVTVTQAEDGELIYWTKGLSIYPETLDEQYWTNWCGSSEQPEKPKGC